MNCHAHAQVPATRSCHACLRPLCQECSEEVVGAFYCEPCLHERLQPHVEPRRPRSIKVPFLASLLSVFVPGLGQVYNGLVGRALFQFGSWMLAIWSLQFATGDPVAAVMVLGTCGLWIWQVVDAWRTAKDINRLGRVPDPEEAKALGRGPIPGLENGSRGLGIILIVVGAMILSANFGLSRVLSRLIEQAWPLALLLAGIALIRRSHRERAAARMPLDGFGDPGDMEASR